MKIPNVTSKAILDFIKNNLANKPCDEEIDIDYMERWFLVPPNKYLNIYFHKFIGSDAPVMHDHPWWSCGIILDGWYLEHTPGDITIKDRGSISFRKATDMHWVEKGSDTPVYTLFITGPKKRDWGFQVENLWVSHKDYFTRYGYHRKTKDI